MFESLKVTSGFENSIRKALDSSRLSHAIILEGSDESTRLEVAKIIAKAVVCKGERKPCDSCSSCLKAQNGSHPDIHIVLKAADSSMIKVDSVRDVKSKAMVYPNDGDKSVFIIHEAQYMNIQAQNALLKIFEEPSKHVCIILTCPSKSSLLDTIISRATSYFLCYESSDTLVDEAAKQKAQELLECLVKENELSFLRKCAVFQKNKRLFINVLEAMIPVLRDVLILQSGSKELLSGSDELVKKIKPCLTQGQTVKLLEQTIALKDCVDSSANHNLSITRFSAVLYSIVKG